MSAGGARTATFLMTDIEGSTRLWEKQRPEMAVALETHDVLLRAAVERAGGEVVKTTGDGLLAVFDRPEAGLTAAVEAQLALGRQAWPTEIPLRVRMALHSGSVEVRDDDYFGPTLNRTARLMAIAHGGQVLVSSATSALVADDLPPACGLLDLGEHQLRDLDRPELVYQLLAEGLQRDFAPLHAVATHPSNLRPAATTFVGREKELLELGRLLETSRLLTLVGVGGTGKTRLELQVAADALDRYPGGAWLIEFAPISDPDLVVTEIGRVLGVQPRPGQAPIDALAEFLRPKELLLLLDNCEHLIDAVALTVQVLLGSCPALHVLASSREPLGVDGEAIFPVPSLALPAAAAESAVDATNEEEAVEMAAESEAIRLFVDRATATLPGFRLDRSNVRSVVDICRRLDGIPLAIELAAARMNVLSADEIARGLDDRFRLLTGGRRTAVPRQRTLQALIDWSWDLLDETDQHLLSRLAVFAGGWTLDAAAAVTGEQEDAAAEVTGSARMLTLDGLGRLADRSLVVVTHAETTRYGMLETIRQYASDRLAASGSAEELRQRHLALYRRLVLDAATGLVGPEMIEWLARVDAEIDNVRAALDWAFEVDPRAALEMLLGLGVYWPVRLTESEGFDRMNQAVELARPWRLAADPTEQASRSALVARTLAQAALVRSSYTGRSVDAAAEAEATEMAQEAGDPVALANTLVTLAFARVAVHGAIPVDSPAGKTTVAALELAEEYGDWFMASLIAAAFAVAESMTDAPAAQVWLDRATYAAQRTGNPFALGNITGVRGRVAARAGRLEEAERSFVEGREQYRALGDSRFDRILSSELGHVLRRQGRLDEAEAEYRQTIRGWQHSGNLGAVANQLECFAYLAIARHQWARAARLLGAAQALRDTSDAQRTDFEVVEYETALDRLRSELDPAELAAATLEGQGLTDDAAVQLALSA